MHIHTHHTAAFMLELLSSLMQDPRSLERWRCLYFNASQAGTALSHPTAPEIKRISETLAEEPILEDVEMVLLPDGDIFIFGKDLTVSVFDAILWVIQGDDRQQDITHAIAIYDLLRQWSEVRSLIEHKTGKQAANLSQPPASDMIDPFPADVLREIASLEEMFHATKPVRHQYPGPLKILIVEDDVVSRQLVACAFKNDHTIIMAKNAQEALSQYLLYCPDIVFLDINLPDYNGFQVLHYLRQQDHDAFIVMFSGSDDLAHITQSIAAGARGFVAKPFNRDKLQHYVTEYKLNKGVGG